MSGLTASTACGGGDKEPLNNLIDIYHSTDDNNNNTANHNNVNGVNNNTNDTTSNKNMANGYSNLGIDNQLGGEQQEYLSTRQDDAYNASSAGRSSQFHCDDAAQGKDVEQASSARRRTQLTSSLEQSTANHADPEATVTYAERELMTLEVKVDDNGVAVQSLIPTTKKVGRYHILSLSSPPVSMSGYTYV